WCSSMSNADVRFILREPGAIFSRPRWISNNVIVVVQIDSEGCESSQRLTTFSGDGCIRAERTLVSRMIIDGTWLALAPDREVQGYLPAGRRSSQSGQKSGTPTLRAHHLHRERRCAGYVAPPPPCSVHVSPRAS